MACFAEETGLESKIVRCDTVITGEGRFDAQTLTGKAVSEVMRLSRLSKKSLSVVCASAESVTGEDDASLHVVTAERLGKGSKGNLNRDDLGRLAVKALEDILEGSGDTA